MNFPDINLLDVFVWLVRTDFLLMNGVWIFIGMLLVALFGSIRYHGNLARRNAKKAEAAALAAKARQQEQETDPYRDN